MSGDDGIITDEEFAEQVSSGRLVKFESAHPVVRPLVLDVLRENVRNWRKPRLKQDIPKAPLPPLPFSPNVKLW